MSQLKEIREILEAQRNEDKFFISFDDVDWAITRLEEARCVAEYFCGFNENDPPSVEVGRTMASEVLNKIDEEVELPEFVPFSAHKCALAALTHVRYVLKNYSPEAAEHALACTSGFAEAE